MCAFFLITTETKIPIVLQYKNDLCIKVFSLEDLVHMLNQTAVWWERQWKPPRCHNIGHAMLSWYEFVEAPGNKERPTSQLRGPLYFYYNPSYLRVLVGDLSKTSKDISDANKLAKKVRPQQAWADSRKKKIEFQAQSGVSRQSVIPAIPTAKEWFFSQRPSPKIKVQEGGKHKTNLTPIQPATRYVQSKQL